MQSASKALGEFIVSTSYEKLPKEVIEEAKKRIADVVGIGLSGARTEAGKIVGFCTANGGAGNATVWGTGEKTSPAFAALANGTMVFHLELDDVHRTSHTHPGVSCVPAALAIGEERHSSGKEIIEAVVIGYDASIRVGMAVSPSIYVDRTYLAPGTLSPFGAAASTAKLMKTDAETAGKALGAVSYYGPTACYESFKLGADCKDLIMGWGNLCGIYGVQLALTGCGGLDSAIEGDYGFCKTVSARYDMSRFFNRLGSYYEIMFTGVKPYACCRQHHAAIDCMLEMREKYGLKIEDIDHVKVRTFVVSSRGNNQNPNSIPAAKYSIPYIMGVTVRYGEVWREQFTQELICDRELLDFANHVEVVPDYELDKLYDEKWPSIVEVTLKDGSVISARRDLPKGEPEYPCSTEDIHEKFISLACDTVSLERAEKIWDTIMHIEDLEDISELTQLLVSDRT